MPRPTAVARCIHCTWAKQMTDDTVEEVETWLRRELVEHVRAQHTPRPN